MPFLSRSIRTVLLACLHLLPVWCLLLTGSHSANAWGVTGHHYTNGLAVDCLPSQLKPLYEANRAWIIQHSTDPDEWRSVNFAIESPRHFIDLDIAGPEGARDYPDDYWLACGILGKDQVNKNGIVPWRIAEYYGKLVRAFRAGDARTIIEISAWLGHYASDVHVPFHATANYDGQLTGQKGIHARFESAMVEQFIKPTDLKARTAVLIKDPAATAFRWARTSLSLCPEILEADKRGVQQDAGYGYNYFVALASAVRPIAVRRLEESARDTASLWMTAWIEAGRPAVPAASDVHAGQPLEQRTHDPDIQPVKPTEPAGSAGASS